MSENIPRSLCTKNSVIKMDKLKQLINLKIEEIENLDISTQENEERYIQEINCLVYAKYLLFGDENLLVD